MDTHPVTMNMLAKAAGVSQPTVSRALKGDPRISAVTKARIQEAARSLGYRPDPRLSALAAYRSSIQRGRKGDKIAIWNFPRRNEEITSLMRRELPGIQRRAEELGYSTEIYSFDPTPQSQKRLSRILYSQGVRAILVGSMPPGHQRLDDFDWEKFSAVVLSFSLQSPKLDFVAQDHTERCHMVYRKLRELGYFRIGFCGRVDVENNNRHLQVAAYLRSLFLDGVPLEKSPPLLYHRWNDFNPLPWMKKHRFDAVMATLPHELIKRMKGTDFELPRIGVAGIGLSPDAVDGPDVTGGVQDFELLGSVAVDLLHQLLCHGIRGIPQRRQCILLEGTWHDGETTRRQNVIPASFSR